MHKVLYFVGAGLTKALELQAPIPLMNDFLTVMANYLHNDVILTTLAEFENAGSLFVHESPAARGIARTLVGTNPDRSTSNRDRFARALRERSPENLEVVLERSLDVVNGGSLHARFVYAITQLFCEIGWNVNWHPLFSFLRRQLVVGARHWFVDFNYDLLLDHALEATMGWTLAGGYGFPVSHGAIGDPSEQQAGSFKGVTVARLPSANTDLDVTLIKPHGSLNWLVPYELPSLLSKLAGIKMRG